MERHPQPNVFDFSPEFLNMAIHLMLAQAQECFYEKAVKDNMKASIIAKLAAQVADYYEFTLTLVTNSALSSIVPKNWASHIQVKIAIYKANAQYRTAIAHAEADEYGSQVARLQIAFNLLEEAKKKHLKHCSSDLQGLFNSEHSVISAALQTAEKENDNIYHEPVPNESKLAPIEKKPIVKAIPLPESVHLIGEKDPFYRLVPFAITEKLSVYQERKDSLVRNEIRQIDEQNQIAIGSLSSMQLPGAIEALETPIGIPKTLQDKVNSIRQEGGIRLINELIETLNNLAREDTSILNEAIQKLDAEEKEDVEARQQFGNSWIRTPSHTLTPQLRQESAKFLQNIEHARKSDAFVIKRFNDQQQFIAKLSGTQEELLSLLPSSNGGGNSSSIVASLKQSLTLLDQLIAERSNLRQQLTNLSKNDDISSSLMGFQGDSEEIFAQELKKYEAFQTRLQQSYATQVSLLERIQKENSQFVASKQSNNMNAQREQVLQQLNTAFKVYTELKSNLTEGIQFYTQFQDILKAFKRKCEDFVFARATEKQELIKDIQEHSHQPQQQFQSQSPQYPQQQFQPQRSPQQYSSQSPQYNPQQFQPHPPPQQFQPHPSPQQFQPHPSPQQYPPQSPQYNPQFYQPTAPPQNLQQNVNPGRAPPSYQFPGQPNLPPGYAQPPGYGQYQAQLPSQPPPVNYAVQGFPTQTVPSLPPKKKK